MFYLSQLTFFSCRMISLTACWTIELLSCCLTNLFLVSGSCLCSLVDHILEYLKLNPPRSHIHLMNFQGHGWEKFVWIYPSDDLHNFVTLSSTLTNLVVSSWWSGFYSRFPADTINFVICPSNIFPLSKKFIVYS